MKKYKAIVSNTHALNFLLPFSSKETAWYTNKNRALKAAAKIMSKNPGLKRISLLEQ